MSKLKTNGIIKKTFSLLVALTLCILPCSFVSPTLIAATPDTLGMPYTANGTYDVTVPHVVINQIYASGNNKGAGSHGFIELYNPTAVDVDLSHWSIQYMGSACDEENTGWQKLDLAGILPSETSFLIRTNGYDHSKKPHNYDIPVGDLNWDITLNNKGLSVVLLADQKLINNAQKVFDNAAHKPLLPYYVDMASVNGNDALATQQAPFFEDSASDSQSSKKAIRRINFVDTDNNNAASDTGDFQVVEYNANDMNYLDWARPRTLNDGKWQATDEPEYVETTQLSDTAINTLTTSIFDNAKTSRTFTWQMPLSITTGKVILGRDALLTDAQTINATMTTNQKATAHIFTAIATALKPGTTYYYQVISDEITSDIYSFTTEGAIAAPFTFVHLSDSQSKTEDGYDVLSDALTTITKTYSPEFLLHTGDLVDTCYFEDEWRWLFDKSRDIFATYPLFAAVGNHDQTPKYPATAFSEHLFMPNSCTDPKITPDTVYSFDYGTAHFVILNSQCTEGLDAEKEWLEEDLSNTKQKFIIVAMHRSPYGGIGIAEDVFATFADTFDKYKVDLVLFGHDHSYIKTKALVNKIEDPCGTIYLQGGGCSSKQDSASKNFPPYADITGTPGAPVYNIITITEDQIIVKTVTVDTEADTAYPLSDNPELNKSSEASVVDFTITAKTR